jgi:cell wall-associated NlpC family hydrolase
MISPKSLLPALCLLVAVSGPALADTDTTEDLFLYAVGLVGTPYQAGGTSAENGVDCSGFVRLAYEQALHTRLPRTAQEMSHVGIRVDEHDLHTGDLVFFNTLDKPYSHVGIYLGEGRFIHASSGAVGSVTISSLHDEYWQKRFEGARRPFMDGSLIP